MSEQLSHHLSVQCLLCHSSGLFTWTIGNKGRSYLACPQCQFVSLNIEHRIAPDLEKQRYLRHHNDIQSSDYMNYVRSNLQNIELLGLSVLRTTSVDRKDMSILDFGCGRDPVLSKELQELGYSVLYYDYYFFADNDYLNKTYDLILLIEVIEHLSDPRAVMQVLKKQLRPGGRVVIRTEPLTFEEGFFKRWWYPGDKTHISFFNDKSMQVLAAAVDLKAQPRRISGP